MKKLKHKIIIPIATALSSLALVAPCACANTTKVVNSDNNSSVVNSIEYTTITYNTTDNVTLIGSNRVKARTGVIFGTVLKPEARHSLNYEFKGWSTSQDKADIINNYTELTKSSYSLYPIFAPKARSVEISGKTQVVASVSSTYTLQSVPSGAFLTPVWSEVSKTTKSGTITFNTSTGVLTTTYDAIGTITIGCTDSATGIAADNLTIDIVPPYMVNDGLWTVYTIQTAPYNKEWRKIALEDGCDICTTKGTVSTTKLDGTAGETIYKTALDTLYIGNEVTAIPDNFCISMGSWDRQIIFQSTSKCAYIGKGFLYNCGAWHNNYETFTLPSSLRTIDDEFMYGCQGFCQTIELPYTAATETTAESGLTWIGESFMNGCIEFNKDLTIPKTVTHVGNDFMANIQKMVSTIYINCEAEAFDVPSSEYSNTLTTTSSSSVCYTTGVQIGGLHADDFVSRFENRNATPYRWLMLQANFNGVLWENVATACNTFEAIASPTVDDAKTLCTALGVDASATTKTTAQEVLEENLVTDDIYGIANINGQSHKVRCIGAMVDTISTGQTSAGNKAALKFELVNVLTNRDGSSLKTGWDLTNNYNYLNSVLRWNLTGAGSGTQPSEGLWDKSAWGMLSDSATGTQSLANNIKKVDLQVRTYDSTSTTWVDTDYQDKLFPLSVFDVYTWTAEKRIKFRVKDEVVGHENMYWLINPVESEPLKAYSIDAEGTICQFSPITHTTTGVSFAFNI